MSLYDSKTYLNCIKKVARIDFLDFERLTNKSIFISGASGLIGSFFIDLIMFLNDEINLNCTIYALCRSIERTIKRFEKYNHSTYLKLVHGDINYPINCIENIEHFDYVIHLASNTHPIAYATKPIETISTNIIGTNNMLELAEKYKAERVVFSSSCEIYGENIGSVDKFSEEDLGYINCNTMRAGYPESKRCGEAICQAYISQKGMDIVIPRFSRIFGPTMLMNDSKAISQFILNGLHKESIVLKSDGKQFYSYLYVADAVSGLLKILFDGKSGEAYNLSDEKSDITLKDLASIIAKVSDSEVTFAKPDDIEKSGYSKATKAVLDSTKIKKLGWKAQYDITEGITETMEILSYL